MIVINCLDITNVNQEIYEKFYSIVSKKRQQKADKFYFLSDSKRCVCAEILLRYSLQQHFGYIPDLTLSYNQYGKASLININDFFYNISHSGKWVVLAYTNSEVGIDIEKILFDKDKIAKNFFTKDEQLFIFSATDKVEIAKRFTQIWTLKESYVKYLGTGLFTSFDSFSINCVDGKVVVSRTNEKIKNIKLNSGLFDDNYYLSVCSNNKKNIINFIQIENLNFMIHIE